MRGATRIIQLSESPTAHHGQKEQTERVEETAGLAGEHDVVGGLFDIFRSADQLVAGAVEKVGQLLDRNDAPQLPVLGRPEIRPAIPAPGKLSRQAVPEGDGRHDWGDYGQA